MQITLSHTVFSQRFLTVAPPTPIDLQSIRDQKLSENGFRDIFNKYWSTQQDRFEVAIRSKNVQGAVEIFCDVAERTLNYF